MISRIHLSALIGLAAIATSLPARDRDDNGARRSRAVVTFYEHAGFRGESFAVRSGESLDNLSRETFDNGTSINDRISSIRIEGEAVVFLYQDAGFRGGVLRLTSSVRNLDEYAPGWNDRVSSIRVEHDRGGRDGAPDPRQIERAERMIQRAYREILRREPDPDGLQSYRRHILEEGWDEEQLRHALWTSDEYREVVMRIVVRAYQDLLGREPEPRGARLYRDRMLHEHWTEEQVRADIRKSDEYRRRHP